MQAFSPRRRLLVHCLCYVLIIGCAPVPRGRYGVRRLELHGVEQLDERALRACLVTRERSRVEIGPGAFSPRRCGVPPFDEPLGTARLWTWPWSGWPIFERGVFDLDLERIERWYEARGFYHARVTELRFDPEAGRASDRTLDPPEPPCRMPELGCPLKIEVHIDEGQPVLVEEIVLEGIEKLPDGLEASLRDILLLQPGQRFDELYFERSKESLREALGEASYAEAIVTGRAEIHRTRRTARVVYRIDPGPPNRFGHMYVEGAEDLPEGVIRASADIRSGDPYSESAIDDAQREVYRLGAFSSVVIEPLPDEHEDVVHLMIRVRPMRRQRFRIGAGISSGLMRRMTADETVSVPQWDVHLLFGYEHRNFLGGLRRLRIEERPRLIFPDVFPRLRNVDRDQGPQLGNVLLANFQQPGVLDPRTTLFSDGLWDWGPDPFLGFLRHDISINLGLRRAFLGQRLSLSVAVQQDFYLVQEPVEPTPLVSSSYTLPLLAQMLVLDLRDDAIQPRRGAYFDMGAQQALRLGYGSWNYLRLTPDARGYLPLPLGSVLAARFALGFLFIFDADPTLDPFSQTLGPQPYRLRGGGANSVRGYLPGRLGVGLQGGIRRWEGSIEVRMPLLANVTMALFGDVGDVNDQPRMRFDHLNTSVGFGFRYRTVVGPVRLDLGWRVPGAQVVGVTDNGRFQALPNAVHLTIGEPF